MSIDYLLSPWIVSFNPGLLYVCNLRIARGIFDLIDGAGAADVVDDFSLPVGVVSLTGVAGAGGVVGDCSISIGVVSFTGVTGVGSRYWFK